MNATPVFRKIALATLLLGAPGVSGAQNLSTQSSPPSPAAPAAGKALTKDREYTIRMDVGLVVLHATVVDKKGQRVDGLRQDNFRVYEDGQAQKLSVFSHADIPLTLGIVIDDSGSMREKRGAVSAAALTFVKTSNPQDQPFVVNFNDVYYLDTPGDFAKNLDELKAALDKIDSRGGTALYDAVYASLDHSRLGSRDKKVLLVITDGEDNASRYTFEELIRHAQQGGATVYAIGLLGDEEPGGLFKLRGAGPRRAAKILQKLAEATGGQAYFPKSLGEVEPLCAQIARDIRDQYTLAYYPTNPKKDGTFRAVRVEAVPSATRAHLTVRTRPGYYAPKAAAASSPAPPATAASKQ